MYFISIVSVVCISGLLLMLGQGSVVWFIDMPSLVVILLFDVTILLSAGLGKDFNNAFRMMVKKEQEDSVTAVKRAIEAVRLVRKTTLAAGVFSMMFSLIMVMGQLGNPEMFGPNLAVASLTLLYALAFILMLLPLESRLRMKLQGLLQD